MAVSTRSATAGSSTVSITGTSAPLTEAKRRIVDRLKRVDDATAAELATGLGLTGAAIRQHLDALAANGLVVARPRPARGRGRPAAAWALTDLARELFPDRHADLTVELIGSLRRALGPEGLDAVIAERSRAQTAAYRAALPPPSAPLRERAEALALVRTGEGYLAEVVDAPDGDGLLLIEHHCPICDAAKACTNLCSAELDLFREVLGPDVEVIRTQHLIQGDQRCAYRLRPT
jgi:predicted ArsR family transcriptional regulator